MRNLPPECGAFSLWEGFGHCGGIERVETEESSVAVVVFKTRTCAERAIGEEDMLSS